MVKINEFYIYEWFIKETGEVFYIGKGKGNRYKKTKRNKFFNDMYNSHKCDVRIIENNLSEEEAFDKEIERISYYRINFSKYRLTNQTDGGEGTSGWKPSSEFRIKQSKIHKEQWEDETFRTKMLQIRRDKNGIYKSKEFREKISEIVKGIHNPNYKHYWNEEMKQRNRNKMKSRYNGSNNPNAKKIMCIETGEIFDSVLSAQQKYNISTYSSLTIALNQEISRTAGGLHWLFINENNENYFSDEYNRFLYLLKCYASHKNIKYYINTETLKIYNRKELEYLLNISQRKFKKEILNYKNYVLISDYIVALNSDV